VKAAPIKMSYQDEIKMCLSNVLFVKSVRAEACGRPDPNLDLSVTLDSDRLVKHMGLENQRDFYSVV
jgi:hypothetical protein